MASTRNKNSKIDYNLYRRENNRIFDNRIYSKRRIAEKTMLPCAGINVGHMPNTVLSENAIDIESRLYGINSTNLVNPQKDITPKLKSLPSIAFFERPKVFLPEPLVIEDNQRPIRP
tara:strand:- start:2425 stop:2775 length:351 start_codon:yes stop_codon:yes gene_type:complete